MGLLTNRSRRTSDHRQWRIAAGAGAGLLLSLLLAPAAFADEAPLFGEHIRPILESRCTTCHGADRGQADLSLVSLESIVQGGKTGPAIVPGDPAASLLLAKVSGNEPVMPPVGEPLSESEVDLVRRWIAAGAPAGSPGEGGGDSAVWWSFRPLSRPALPEARDGWARNEVDLFVAAKLAEEGLRPSREADRTTLVRRLTYNLHGLPPDPAMVSAFLSDSSPEAYERLVDQLLASPRYGERWGRHWLDVAHYGESHGYDKDKARRHSWPYRDYVIRSFNQDKPYGRFLQEQLAGDFLWPDSAEALIATGFVAAGPWDYVGHAELREGTKDKKLARLLDRDDMVAATMSTFNSLTVHCARCHDHKFDPIRQADYYALQAVFAGVDRAEQPFFEDSDLHLRGRDLWFRIGKVEDALRPYVRMLAESRSPEIDEIDREKAELSEESKILLPKVGEVDTPETIARRMEIGKRLKQLDAQRKDLAIALMEGGTRAEYQRLVDHLANLEVEFKALPDPQYVYSAASYFRTHGTFTPAWEPRPVYVLEKGSVEAPGEPARPGSVGAVPGGPARFQLPPEGREGAARAALADWLANPANPLTWRSIVNRVWHYHFGRGLVETPNDFGRMGARPTHPELLDWLALRFRDGGGSLKQLHRMILLSATYRQSSAPNPELAGLDSGNRYLWRMNRIRLDAEAVRDAVLWVGGQLDYTMGGPPAEHFVFKDDHSPIYDYASFDFASPAAHRRSVYRFLVRSAQDPFMESLDCADPSLLVPRRSSTLTAIQALALLNDPLIVEQTRRFAERLRAEAVNLEDRIGRGFQLAFGRAASPDEVRALVAHAGRHGLENATRLLLNSNEFIFVD